jgi:hypothetical protein
MEPRVLDKHFDSSYNLPYYFDPKSGESLWELPEGKVQIVDKTVEETTQTSTT